MTDLEVLKKALPLIREWYKSNPRPLPWRDSPSPYHVWVSEIMLQQTRIEAVIPYYERFLAEVPDIAALAALEEERLLKLWEGLGYYSRARNLQKAAVIVTEQYGGELPASAEELRKLPGIGDYTAGAIASIAFSLPEPAVDGNVLRVLTRLLADAEDISSPAVRKNFTSLLREFYPSGEDAGLLTQGLMELGELICLPSGEIRCADCPVRTLCRSGRDGKADLYPVNLRRSREGSNSGRCFSSNVTGSMRSVSGRKEAFLRASGSFLRSTAGLGRKNSVLTIPMRRRYAPAEMRSMFSATWNGI